jgi:hypothetical protein
VGGKEGQEGQEGLMTLRSVSRLLSFASDGFGPSDSAAPHFYHRQHRCAAVSTLARRQPSGMSMCVLGLNLCSRSDPAGLRAVLQLVDQSLTS